jgi:predicted Rossmann-fold nucleotide-binding protein
MLHLAGDHTPASFHRYACCCAACRPAASTLKGRELVVHGGGAGPGKITAAAKAALGGTIMIPTAAGGQVGGIFPGRGARKQQFVIFHFAADNLDVCVRAFLR